MDSALAPRCVDFSALPPCPYQPGFKTTIYPHRAPPPFGLRDYDGHSRETLYATDDALRGLARVEAVLEHPPRGPLAADYKEKGSELSITKVIVGGNHFGAQIVVCTIETKGQPSFSAVAKIYDPLYYDIHVFEWGQPEGTMVTFWTQLDVMGRADGEYSRDVAAYEKLKSANMTEGSFTAKYHGSWTFTLPIACPSGKGSKDRAVRMILLEHLDGPNIRQLSLKPDGDTDGRLYLHYHMDVREDIMAKLLHIEKVVEHAGIYHGDFNPRNIILLPHPIKKLALSKQPSIRVVLVDFGTSLVIEEAHKDSRFYGWEGYKAMPLNPIERDWTSTNPYLNLWLPEVMDDKYKRRKWLVDLFGKNDGIVYKRVDRPLDIKWEQ